MINLQPAEKQVKSDGLTLDVQGDPWYTIQGEGPLAGTPAVFVRLAGCSLLCPGCDTDYTSKRRQVDVEALVGQISALKEEALVVITGGEPFRQPLGPFVRGLQKHGHEVQIETNGTLWDDTLTYKELCRMTIVCSPKTGSINSQLQSWITAYKYVLTAGQVDPEDGLPTSSLNFGVQPARPFVGTDGYVCEVFVSPCDEQDEERNRLNVQTAVESCMKFGYRLSLQTHKIIGVA